MKTLTLMIGLTIVLLMAPSIAIAAIAQKGPASDRIIISFYRADELYNAFANGTIDYAVDRGHAGYITPSIADHLKSLGTVNAYPIYSRMFDILLNPAPVYTKTYVGSFTKNEIAEMEGIPACSITYIKVQNGTTYVEFGAYPGKGVNPFAFKDIRFAMNYLLDRDLIVRNVFSGYAIPTHFATLENSPMYNRMLPDILEYTYYESMGVAKERVRDTMECIGAVDVGGKWYYYGEPVNVSVIIRIEDQRRQLGDSIADGLEFLGFNVTRRYYDFMHAINTVYRENPMNFTWHVYTEGWSIWENNYYNIIYLSAPRLGLMPGWGNPDFWNYHNSTIDELAIRLLSMSPTEPGFTEYFNELVEMATEESVRVYAVMPAIYEAYSTHMQNIITIGSEETYLGNLRIAYNPESNTTRIAGVYRSRVNIWPWNMARFSYNIIPLDAWSTLVINALFDPPYYYSGANATIVPFRATYNVTITGESDLIEVPRDTVTWDVNSSRWIYVPEGTTAKVKVVFDLTKYIGSKWHDGSNITFSDVLASYAAKYILYHQYTRAWYDSLEGIRILPSQNIVEVYLNPPESYQYNTILKLADPDLVIPAEVIYLQYYVAYINQSYGFPFSGKPEINLIDPEQIPIFNDIILRMLENNTMPDNWFTINSTEYMSIDEWRDRLLALLEWLNAHNNAFVGQGPYMLTDFDPETKTFNLTAFRDESYPFTTNDLRSIFWEHNIQPPEILNVNNTIVEKGHESKIDVTVAGSQPITVAYTVVDPSTGETLFYGLAEQSDQESHYIITISPDQSAMLNESKIYELVIEAKNLFPVLEYRSIPLHVEPDAYTTTLVEEGETANITVNSTSTETQVSLNATESVQVMVAVYENLNETGIETEYSQPVGYAVDIYTNNTDGIEWPVNIEVKYNESALPEGTNESNLAIYYYNKTMQRWMKCSSTGVDTDNNIVWANLTREEYEAGIGNIFTLQTEKPIRNLTPVVYPGEPIEITADDRARFYIEISNTGELVENVTANIVLIQLYGNLSIPMVDVTPKNASIPIGGTQGFNVTLTPNGVGRYFVAVNITSDDGELSLLVPVTIDVTNILHASSDKYEATVLDNESAIYQVTIKNLGLTDNTFDIKVYNGTSSAAQITVPPNETRTIQVYVAGEEGIIKTTVEIVWTENSLINKSLCFTTHIIARYKFKAELLENMVVGKVGQAIPLKIKIDNLGALSDLYTIMTDHGLPINVSVPANSSSIITINITYNSTGFYTEKINITSLGSGHKVKLETQVEIGKEIYTVEGTGILTLNADQANATVKVNSNRTIKLAVLIMDNTMTPTLPPKYEAVGIPFDLVINDTNSIIYPVIVNISYSGNVQNEEQLVPLRYDYNKSEWIPFKHYEIHPEDNIATVYIQEDELKGVPIILGRPSAMKTVGGILIPTDSIDVGFTEISIATLSLVLSLVITVVRIELNKKKNK